MAVLPGVLFLIHVESSDKGVAYLIVFNCKFLFGFLTISVKDVVTLNYGKGLPKSNRSPEGTYPVFGANGIMDRSDQQLTVGPSIIIGRKGSAGELNVSTGPFWPTDVTYFTSHDPSVIDFDYLYNFYNQNIFTAIFPNSTPFYYDIHALRRKKWNTVDAWEEYKRIGKYVPVGKFFIRYFLVYGKQRKITSNQKLIDVDSAFGGFGFYKVSKNIFPKLRYNSNKSYSICEHIYFNLNFKCAIDPTLNVKAPSEHIEFKLLPLFKKIVYICNSLASDGRAIFNSLKRLK